MQARCVARVSTGLLCLLLALTLSAPGWAVSQPTGLASAQGRIAVSIVTQVDYDAYHNTVCTPSRPYYKPRGYQRYWRHRFRPFRDYVPYDPPLRCASWPWSTDVCVGQDEPIHPLPVGKDCVR
jgi:hypothetical protein